MSRGKGRSRRPAAHRRDAPDAALLAAYRTTRFVVDIPGKSALTLRIGRQSARADALLRTWMASRWAFITAWNPGSRSLSAQANARRHRMLRCHVLALGRTFFTGRGIGADANWTPEESLWIVGLDLRAAKELGRRFGQNCIVVGARGRAARLVACAGHRASSR
ncbi:MAG: DUF3293 domain-containing protein [Planctomycetes bacterium]|nr:DUF3293 domain-containing protein [Planctomycetota bacterium]